MMWKCDRSASPPLAEMKGIQSLQCWCSDRLNSRGKGAGELLFVGFFFPAHMRAGAAFKKRPWTLDYRNAPEGVSGEGTCCWGQSGSWWVLTNTSRWKISVGEKDPNTSVCHKTGVKCPVFTASGLCPAFNLPNSRRIGVWRSAMPGSGWDLDSFFGQLSSAPLDACKNPCLQVFNWNHSFPVSGFW